MRIVSLVPAAGLVLALVATSTTAEARGRRAFGGVWTATHAAVPTRIAPVAVLSASGLRGSEATEAKAEPTTAPKVLPLPLPEAKSPEQKPVIREAVANPSWCAKGRVFGSGAGFCEIN